MQVDRKREEGDPEVKKTRLVKATKTQPTVDIYGRFTKYSSFKRLITSFAYLQKATRLKSLKPISKPTVAEMEETQKWLLKLVQSVNFTAKIRTLQANQDIPKSSSCYQLNPYLDEGLLRVGGRARRSPTLTLEEKHPVLLPCNEHVSMLVIKNFHDRVQHQGQAMTLAAIRSAGFWIMGAMRMVKRVIHTCTPCNRMRRKLERQKMGDLPKERLESTPPFTHIGIDCFGSFVVKDRRSEVKRWGLVITCMYSRAVHVEVLDDMTTDCVISALRCLIALRGAVKAIHCDQGTNFVGAHNELLREFQARDSMFNSFLANKMIQFKFNAPQSSHAGGTWERQIRTIKCILQQMLLKHKSGLDTASLRTLLYEVAPIVNHRPLSNISIHDYEDLPLTPDMILTGKSGIASQTFGEFTENDVYHKKRWIRVQALAEEFWRRWKVEYLANIVKRQKWTTTRNNLQEWGCSCCRHSRTKKPLEDSSSGKRPQRR